jgi:hypothetical protein
VRGNNCQVLEHRQPKKRSLKGKAAPAQHPEPCPRADCRRGDPRSMVPVRRAGAEVTETFWAKLAVLS